MVSDWHECASVCGLMKSGSVPWDNRRPPYHSTSPVHPSLHIVPGVPRGKTCECLRPWGCCCQNSVCATSRHGETAGEVCYAGGTPPAAGGAFMRESQERTTSPRPHQCGMPGRRRGELPPHCNMASLPHAAVRLVTRTCYSLERGSA